MYLTTVCIHCISISPSPHIAIVLENLSRAAVIGNVEKPIQTWLVPFVILWRGLCSTLFSLGIGTFLPNLVTSWQTMNHLCRVKHKCKTCLRLGDFTKTTQSPLVWGSINQILPSVLIVLVVNYSLSYTAITVFHLFSRHELNRVFCRVPSPQWGISW